MWKAETSGGEDSAWVSLIRLLARGNTDVACSIDLWLIELEFELSNFSVAILTELAHSRDPDNMASGVSLWGMFWAPPCHRSLSMPLPVVGSARFSMNKW